MIRSNFTVTRLLVLPHVALLGLSALLVVARKNGRWPEPRSETVLPLNNKVQSD